MERIVLFLKQFGILILVGVVGGGILIYGVWQVVGVEGATVEIIKNNPSRSDLLVTVDIAGAVEKPGVYKLPSGSRIGDALVMAGGLSGSADREWVSKTINLAEEVKDGGKIFIPRQSENSESQNTRKPENQSVTVNINTASVAELDGLSGIGEARAQAIIANRPYGKTEELVSKAKIPQSVYDKIKDSISVY